MAAAYSSGASERLFGTPFLAFHVSGGTTEMLYVCPQGESFSVSVVGETDDINAGQLIDRVGVMMGLSFPAGREMEKAAAEFTGKIYKHQVCVREGRCSLSGGENIAAKIYEKNRDRSETAAFVFDFVCRTLIAMGEQAEEKYGRTAVLFAGGVMSNSIIKNMIRGEGNVYFSQPAFSADNAAGVALLCRAPHVGGEGLGADQ
jgi:N6-L-threonylcarbamoyladenine synthase